MKAQFKVGILFLVTVGAVIAFVFALGSINLFSNHHTLVLLYNFAGGIEVGSPIRVMGIKVGKVRSIVFDPAGKAPSGEEVKLRIEISVDKMAWSSLREDSQFFINLAGVIGEKFIEITPGSFEKAELQPGQLIRGEDPPRIDQLISQSYSLAGKIIEFVNKNEGSVIDTIEMMNKLVSNLNQTLKLLDKVTKDKDAKELLQNLIVITADVAFFTQQARGPDGQKMLTLISNLIRRLDPLDAEAIRKFLQKEGIKAKLF